MSSAENSGPFEGPEKLLEIWFAASPASVPQLPNDVGLNLDGGALTGLRAVKRKVWEDMLDIVKCKVLSVVNGKEIDAYLLSESSLFVFPHKLILKTCGTTLNLLGLPRILAIAAEQCNMPSIWRCFYSRKSFMFPERQAHPHREWKAEVEYLDNIFHELGGGAAYTVGKVNGDHWLLYMTNPGPCVGSDVDPVDESSPEDYTIELLMCDLAPSARAPFFFTSLDPESDAGEPVTDEDNTPEKLAALALSRDLGISAIFPEAATTLDAYAFTPCGYSANALVSLPHEGDDDNRAEEGYYTIHVTPEEGWSFASFECNVQLAPERKTPVGKRRIPDLQTLVQRVVDVFQPGRLSVTLFVSVPDSSPPSPSMTSSISSLSSSTYSTAPPSELGIGTRSVSSASSDDEGEAKLPKELPLPTTIGPARFAALSTSTVVLDHIPFASEVEGAQRAFYHALAGRGYRRTDKINYEFGGYDLAFASFEKKAKASA